MSEREEMLAARVAWLEDRLRDLLGGDTWVSIRKELKLSPQQSKVLALLIARPGAVVRSGVILHEVFIDEMGEGPEVQILFVIISTLRKRLKALGAPDGISASWGTGYTVTPDLADWVFSKIKPTEVAA